MFRDRLAKVILRAPKDEAWRRSCLGALRDAHLAAALSSGLPDADAAAFAQSRSAKALPEFDLISRTVPGDGAGLARLLDLAASSVHVSFQEALRKHSTAPRERRLCGHACPACANMASLGWQPKGVLPPVGSCCEDCRCTYEFSWDESKHPRAPKGSEGGGRFASKHEAEAALRDAARQGSDSRPGALREVYDSLPAPGHSGNNPDTAGREYKLAGNRWVYRDADGKTETISESNVRHDYPDGIPGVDSREAISRKRAAREKFTSELADSFPESVAEASALVLAPDYPEEGGMASIGEGPAPAGGTLYLVRHPGGAKEAADKVKASYPGEDFPVPSLASEEGARLLWGMLTSEPVTFNVYKDGNPQVKLINGSVGVGYDHKKGRYALFDVEELSEKEAAAGFSFDPQRHPRHGKGSKEGGRFRKAGGASTDYRHDPGLPVAAKADALAKLAESMGLAASVAHSPPEGLEHTATVTAEGGYDAVSRYHDRLKEGGLPYSGFRIDKVLSREPRSVGDTAGEGPHLLSVGLVPYEPTEMAEASLARAVSSAAAHYGQKMDIARDKIHYLSGRAFEILSYPRGNYADRDLPGGPEVVKALKDAHTRDELDDMVWGVLDSIRKEFLREKVLDARSKLDRDLENFKSQGKHLDSLSDADLDVLRLTLRQYVTPQDFNDVPAAIDDCLNIYLDSAAAFSFDPSKHPRHGKGEAGGGRFKKIRGAESAPAAYRPDASLPDKIKGLVAVARGLCAEAIERPDKHRAAGKPYGYVEVIFRGGREAIDKILDVLQEAGLEADVVSPIADELFEPIRISQSVYQVSASVRDGTPRGVAADKAFYHAQRIFSGMAGSSSVSPDEPGAVKKAAGEMEFSQGFHPREAGEGWEGIIEDARRAELEAIRESVLSREAANLDAALDAMRKQGATLDSLSETQLAALASIIGNVLPPNIFDKKGTSADFLNHWLDGVEAFSFDPSKHPRAGKGTREGGRFVRKGGKAEAYAISGDEDIVRAVGGLGGSPPPAALRDAVEKYLRGLKAFDISSFGNRHIPGFSHPHTLGKEKLIAKVMEGLGSAVTPQEKQFPVLKGLKSVSAARAAWLAKWRGELDAAKERVRQAGAAVGASMKALYDAVDARRAVDARPIDEIVMDPDVQALRDAYKKDREAESSAVSGLASLAGRACDDLSHTFGRSGDFTAQIADEALAPIASRVSKSAAFVSSLTSGPASCAVFALEGDKSRAYADWDGGIHVSDRQHMGVIIHEMGHVWEHAEPGRWRRSRQFLAYRTGGTKGVKLKDVYPDRGYDDDEWGNPDRFPPDVGTPEYIGKHYGYRSTEIVSMGLEALFKDPINFAEKDPEYFDFLLWTLGDPPGEWAAFSWEEGLHPRDEGGRFASREGAMHILEAGRRAGMASASAAKKFASAGWEALPEKHRERISAAYRVGKAVEHKVMAGFRKSREVAREVAKERGLSGEKAERLEKVLGTVDLMLAWVVNMPAAGALAGALGLGGLAVGVAVKASSWVPVASLAYLAYSAAKNPAAMLRGARRALGKKETRVAMSDDDGLREVAASFCVADGSEWWQALLASALDMGLTPAEAARAADGAYAADHSGPPDVNLSGADAEFLPDYCGCEDGDG